MRCARALTNADGVIKTMFRNLGMYVAQATSEGQILYFIDNTSVSTFIAF